MRDALAITWLVGAALVYLGPALAHGHSLGPYDLLNVYGLDFRSGVQVHNFVGSDEIQELIPWQALDWMQVHAGHLPLWNPFSVLGLPLAFNMQSSPFSLSVAIGYLFPLALAHTATVIARLLIGAIGVYVFCRVLRLSVLSSTMAATIFELSGGFTIWLGSNISDETAWIGWVFAASLLVARSPRRLRNIVFLAVSITLAMYAGEPQITTVLLVTLLMFVVITQAHRWKAERQSVLRCWRDHAVSVLAAFGLAAPLYLPALQLGPGSARAQNPPIAGLPTYDLTHLLFANYNGSPLSLNGVIGPDNLYVSMLYVGVIAVVLAGLAIVSAWRRPEVGALVAIAICIVVVLFCPPIIALFAHVPVLKVVRILVSSVFLEFAIAALAGIGTESLLTNRSLRDGSRRFGLVVSAVTAGVGVLLIRVAFNASHLTPAERSLRWQSFVWPLVALGVCLLCLLALIVLRHPGVRMACVSSMLLVETAFLISSGSSIWSSSSSFFAPTPAVTTLQQVVGAGVVGEGACGNVNGFSGIGVMPNANLVYGVRQLATYDPIIPSAYYASYGAATHSPAPITLPGVFCPAITSVALAREYGVSFIVEPPGAKGPQGSQYVTTLGGEGLYRVPDSGRATLQAIAARTSRTQVVPVHQPDPTSWRMTIDPTQTSRLHLALTDEPGWSATLNGKPLPLQRLDGVMLQATVPAGHGVVELHYWPRLLSLGLLLALLTLFAFGLALVRATCRRRRSSHTIARPVLVRIR